MQTAWYEPNCITLDGCMDEAVWETVPEHTGFRKLLGAGGGEAVIQTSFRILCCTDRVFVGIKCLEPNMPAVLEGCKTRSLWAADAIELFLSPMGNSFEFYQFAVGVGNRVSCQYYSEAGTIRPDPYGPDWKRAIYTGENYWSVELEIPLTAFYMTSNANWSEEWLVNVCRTRVDYAAGGKYDWSSWCDLVDSFLESGRFPKLGGFPARPVWDDLRISTVTVEIAEETAQGFCGTMTVKTANAEPGSFAFSTENGEDADVALSAGTNEFTVPCCFAEQGRKRIALQLKRLSDGKVFKRFYPVKVSYEPIKLHFAKPEYRTNFYPGQDHSAVEGKVIAAKPVTLKLEGPGIRTQVITPDADGSFCFDTAGFEIGEGLLTASIDGWETQKRIRRLAPTGRRMTWISGGNLIVDGEPVLRRNVDAVYYRGGEAFRRKYDGDNLYETAGIERQKGHLQARVLIPEVEENGGEATRDVKPREEMFRKIDKVLEDNKDNDFAYYYLADEPECRSVSPVYLKYMYDYIAEKDPNHVVLIASRSAGAYADCCDWIEAHAYIDPQVREGMPRYYSRPLHTLGDYIAEIAKLNRPDKCIGFQPSCFSYQFKNIFSDYPTFDEYICHTWAAMIAGGKTLWPYAYHDLNDRAALYEGTRYVFSSFAALDKLVLLGKRTDLYKTQAVRAVLYDKGDEQMFALVNFTNEPQTVTLAGITGQWHEFRHNRMLTGNTFALKPMEVIIGTSEAKDAGLPTYMEMAALVEKLEHERTHRGSLLFNRSRDIRLTASKFEQLSKYKLFDGVLDNYAGAVLKNPDCCVELDLTKVKPRFSKVVVGGFCVGGMQIKLRQNGELLAPEIADVHAAEFSVAVGLKESVCPDALRLEFAADRVELYEIEVY